MQKDLLNFKGLYGENKQESLNFINHERLEIRSKLHDWKIQEHLHTDLFQVFIFSSGEGLFLSESKKISLQAPSILTIPANTLHGFVFQPNVSGEVLTFSESFFEEIFKAFPQIILRTNQIQNIQFDNEKQAWKKILLIKNSILDELDASKPEKSLALQSLFQLLFIEIHRLSSSNTESASSENRTLNYFHSFQKQIRQSVQQSKPIKAYAQDLGITTVHLNRICRALVQKSALEVVQDNVLAEAKKYLTNTDYSISEVAYFLDFKDPAYFSRLFKQHTGLSPKKFRLKSITP